MPDRRRRAGDPPDLRRGLPVDDQVQVDAGMGPPAQRGEVGDGRDDRHAEAALLPQAAEHVGGGGVGRDDHVRPRPRHEPQQRPAADEHRQAPGEPLRRQPRDQPVLQLEQRAQSAGAPSPSRSAPAGARPGRSRRARRRPRPRRRAGSRGCRRRAAPREGHAPRRCRRSRSARAEARATACQAASERARVRGVM